VDPSGVGPVIHERREQARAGQHRVISRDGETYGYQKADSEIANIAALALEKYGPDVSFVYFCDADEAGHAHGILGNEYIDAIARVDEHLSRLYQVLNTRAEKLGEEWLLVLTTDHGHVDQGGHGGDSPQELASFVIGAGIGREHPQWPADFAPHELVSLLLDARA
jgi:predicted AlkP superfamily pyrophosphatase or phosphodiesterase